MDKPCNLSLFPMVDVVQARINLNYVMYLRDMNTNANFMRAMQTIERGHVYTGVGHVV